MKPENVGVWVLDSSFLIESKAVISILHQWEAFKLLEKMVETGRIAFPSQVVNEITATAHPDLPGAWAPGVRARLQHPQSPEDQYLGHVTEVAGGVVDLTKPHKDADSYVLALALQLQTEGWSVCIVTEDIVGRRRSLSIAAASRRLELAWVQTRGFLEECGIPVKSEAGAG